VLLSNVQNSRSEIEELYEPGDVDMSKSLHWGRKKQDNGRIMNCNHQAITEQGFSGSFFLIASDAPHIHDIKIKYESLRIPVWIEALIIDR